MAKKQKKQFKPLSIPIFVVVYVAVIAAVIALDQITKHYVEIAVANHNGKIRVLGDWLTFVWTTNTGATGSLFSDKPWRHWLFFTMTVIGIPVFGWLLWRSRTRGVWGQIAYSFIIGGTIGNATDRVRFAENGFFTGSVRDFIRVEGYFGIFNVADSFLVVGVIIAIVAILFLDNDSLLMTFLNERNAKKEQVANGDVANATDESTAPTEEQQVAEQPDVRQDETEQTDENGRTDS